MKLGCKGLVKKNPKFFNAEVDNSGRIGSAEPLSDRKPQNGNTHGSDGSPKRADDHAARQTLPRDQTPLPPVKSVEKTNKNNKDKSRDKRGLSANFDSSEGLPSYEPHIITSTTTYTMLQIQKEDTPEANSETTTQHYPRNLPPIPDSDRSQNDAIKDASDSSVSPRKLPQPPELDNTESNASHKTKKRNKKKRRSKEGDDVE